MLQGFKWLTVFLLWIYVTGRAVTLAFTHDEAYSFLLIKTDYLKAMTGTANTHWLNSLAMKLGSLLLGDEPWKLRLFSVLAWPVYGYSAVRISSVLQNSITGLLLFFALVLNPYVLDFFSLARGYGLSFAFVMASLWQAFKRVESDRWDLRSWTPVFALAAVAVFSNYTALYFFLSLLAAYILLVIAVGQGKQFWLQGFLWWWVVVPGTMAVAIGNLFFIKYYSGDLEYGGDEAVPSLFQTVAAGSLYVETRFTEQQSYWIPALTYALLAAVFAGMFINMITYLRHRRAGASLMVTLVVCFLLLLTIIFHYLFGTPYLAHRTALIIYPLISVLFFYALDRIKWKASFLQWLGTGIKIIFLLLVLINFYRSFNFSYCHEWKYNADAKRSFDSLQQHGAQKVLVWQWYGGVWINYYSRVYKDQYRFQPAFYLHGDQLKATPGFRDSLQLYDHAVFFPPYDLQRLRTPAINFTVLETFPATGATVVRIEKK